MNGINGMDMNSFPSTKISWYFFVIYWPKIVKNNVKSEYGVISIDHNNSWVLKMDAFQMVNSMTFERFFLFEISLLCIINKNSFAQEMSSRIVYVHMLT